MSEHICRKCAQGNPYPPGTFYFDQQRLALAAHDALWALNDAMQVDRFMGWLARRLHL